MASKPLNSALVKLSSGDWSPACEGSTDMGSLPDYGKKSQPLQDSHPQVIDGDESVSGHESSREKTYLSEFPVTVNICKDSRHDDDEINEMADEPSHLLLGPEHNTTEASNPNAADGISSLQTTQRTNTREIMVQSHVLQKDVSLETDEDLYRGEEEIEKEKKQKVAATVEKESKDALKLGVEPEVDIIEYCQKEWRGTTTVAKIMKEGYEEVSHFFGSIRRVRGDNYCALRATLFQCLSETTKLPQWLDDDHLIELPEKLIKKYDWIRLWKFWHSHGSKKTWVRIKTFLKLLKKKWSEMSEMKIPKEKQAACDEIFQSEEEYDLYEAVKFLMLKTAIDLYNANADGKDVPVFSWLLFARNTSSNPCDFMKNHLNQVGHTGGLEQVEMFLLGYALQCTIKVYRLYKYGTDEFVTQYPDDQANFPVVTLITEDDRHYNVPVRVCEETSL